MGGICHGHYPPEADDQEVQQALSPWQAAKRPRAVSAQPPAYSSNTIAKTGLPGCVHPLPCLSLTGFSTARSLQRGSGAVRPVKESNTSAAGPWTPNALSSGNVASKPTTPRGAPPHRVRRGAKASVNAVSQVCVTSECGSRTVMIYGEDSRHFFQHCMTSVSYVARYSCMCVVETGGQRQERRDAAAEIKLECPQP